LKTRREDGDGWPVSRRYRVWGVWLILVLATAACVGSKGTGLCVPFSSEEKKKVLEELKKNWQDYDVYCDGPVSKASAVIFDPKNDDRNLIGYRYIKVTKEEYVKTAISLIEYMIDHNPSLYRIFDEEQNFYGYVLLAGGVPAPRRVDQKTLELPSYQSPYYVY